MIKKHPVNALAVLTALVAGLALPPGQALAAPDPVPVSITNVSASGDLPSVSVPDGGTIDEGTHDLQIYLSKSINAGTVSGALTVTNSKGEQQFWTSGMSGYSSIAWLTINNLLTPGETYTITLKGGPNGILTDTGAPMAADLKLTLHAAAGPFVATALNVFSDSAVMTNTPSGGTIPRDTTELRMEFNRNLRGTSNPSVTVTDSHGKTAGWTAGIGTGNMLQLLVSPKPLPVNETYTITVKGGANGVRSQAGVALPADLVYTLHTADAPVKQTVAIKTSWSKYHEAETELYHLKAAAGPLTIQTAGWPAGAYGVVTLTDARTNAILLDKELSANDATTSVSIPAAGSYDLRFRQAACDTVTLSAMNLQAPTDTPAIKLPAMKTLETHNNPFTFAASLYNPASAGSVQLSLNDQVIMANVLKADGTLAPVTVDPTTLADGVYNVRVTAQSKDGSSAGIHSRAILVDRVDTFADVPATHWARAYIEVLSALKVVSGRDSTHYAPGQPVTRAEFAKLMAIMGGLTPSDKQVTFADVPDNWAHPYLQSMFEAGLLKGDVVGGQTYMYPNRAISRAEAATILGRALQIADRTAPATSTTFTDYAQIPSWARASVLVLSGMKWISGFPDGSFGPSSQLQRDQAARILSNFVGMQ